MYKHIKTDEVKKKDLGDLVIQKLLNNPQLEGISFGKVEVKRTLKFTANPVSDIYAYVLEGNGIFDIGVESVKVETGDLLYISKNTKYREKGHFTWLAIATPRWNPDDTIFFND